MSHNDQSATVTPQKDAISRSDSGFLFFDIAKWQDGNAIAR